MKIPIENINKRTECDYKIGKVYGWISDSRMRQRAKIKN